MRCRRRAAAAVRAGHPAFAHDIVIERSTFVAMQVFRDEHEPQELLPGLRMDPEVNADQFSAGDVATCFLADFANDGVFG